MNRQIALAYGIAGLAVATALVVVVGSTAGLFGGPAPAPPLAAQVAPTPAVGPPVTRSPEFHGAPDLFARAPSDPEVVYVDEPVRPRRHDDDDHDEDDHHGRGRGDDEDDDD